MNLPDEKVVHCHYLEWLCVRGWENRDIPARAVKRAAENGVSDEEQLQVYVERLEHELAAITRQGFVDYTLLVHDVMHWCRLNDIMVGPGRGSAAGSLVNFLIGITSIDPIEHQLLFERYLSPDRIDFPDIDCDFEDVRRDEVLTYLREKYGDDRVAQIATVMQLHGRSCLKDIGRVLEVPFDEINKVTSVIIQRPSGDERAFSTVEDSFKESDAAKVFREAHQDVYEYSVLAEGLHRQMGLHAAGVVVSPVPVTDVAPVEVNFKDDKATPFISVDKDAVEQLGLVKLDILGLKTLGQLKATLRAIKERRGVVLDLEKLEFNDPAVLQRFTDMEFVGIFQFDSSSVEKLAQGVRFDSFDDLVAMNALNRPGTTRTGVADSWAKRRMGEEPVRKIHPVVDRILKDTEGIALYQEQAARLFIEVGGYTPGEADKVRKLGAKSKGVELVGKEEPKFVAGAVARGFDESVARTLFNALKHQGSYSFNRSHSAAYAAIAYWQMYLKHYYTVEFMWALLKSESDLVTLTKYVKEAKRLDIEVFPPNVNFSKDQWTMRGDSIVASLADVKGVGESAAKDILAKQPFTSLDDFIGRVKRQAVNRKVITALVLADAFGALVPNKKAFVDHAEAICNAKAPSEEYKKHSGEPDFDEDEATIQRSRVCPLAMGRHPLEAYDETVAAMGEHVQLESYDDVAWDGQVGYFEGMITNLKVARLNEKADKSYAHITLEDRYERQLRVKLEPAAYEEHRYLIDRGEGTCIAMAAIKWRNESAKLCWAVDLEDLRQQRKSGTPWDGYGAWFAESPLLRHGAPRAPLRQVLAKHLPRPGGKVAIAAIVAAVKEHRDRKKNLMAFIDFAGYQGSVSAVCFHGSYSTYGEVLSPGSVVKVELVRGDKSSWFLDAEKGCHLSVLEKPHTKNP